MTQPSKSGSMPRRLAVLVAAVVAVVAGTVSGSPSSAAEADQIVFINAVNGPESVDVYLDGSLTAPGLGFGEVTPPLGIADSGDHIVELFVAVSTPPATSAGRSDPPVEPGRLLSQPDDATFAHVDGLVVARLANASLDGDWYAFMHDLLEDCTTGFASRAFSGSADVSARGPGGAGAGVFSTGAATSGSSVAFSESVVVQGFRSDFPGADRSQYAFGTFGFGTVDFAVDQETRYISFGNEGRYGAAEIVVDCVAGRFVSSRSASSGPTFSPSSFVALDPGRLFDTRTAAAPSGALGVGGTIDVQVTGAAGVPASGVTAVVLNVTAVNAAGPGFVTVWPKGSPQASTSNLNMGFAGQTVPNLVTVPVGTDGQVSFFSSSGTHLLADVSGYFVANDSAQSGRFEPVAPARVFDTRSAPEPNGPVAPDGSISVSMAGANGVPTSGASAVVLNLTGIATQAAGFVTAWPSGADRPEASNLNLSGPGNIAPNLVIVPLGEDGSVDFYTSGGAHLFADVFGYFTDDSAPASAAGLFVPTSPARIYDSRPNVFGVGGAFIEADAVRTILVSGFAGVPGLGASAVLANVTATQAAGRGFVSIWPSDLDQPEASNLNLAFAGETRPNAVLVPLSADGGVDLYSQSGTHALFDVFGYFTS